MIYSPLSSILKTKEMALAPNAVLSQDGQAMVSVMVNGKAGVQPSAGAPGEKFAGFLNTQTSAVSFLQTTAVAVERVVLPGSKTVTLGRAPIAGTTFVRDVVTGASVAVDGVTGQVVDLSTAGVPGAELDVTYRYNLTVVEARSRNGDVTPGGYAGLTTGSCGLAQSGTIYTDQFESGLDWAAPGETAVLGANGQLSTKTAHPTWTAVQGTIVALPSVEYPFLGIDFDTY
jgi:hypothetical protein